MLYVKQKCYLQFSSSSAKYVLRVVNMIAGRPFRTISKFSKVQIKVQSQLRNGDPLICKSGIFRKIGLFLKIKNRNCHPKISKNLNDPYFANNCKNADSDILHTHIYIYKVQLGYMEFPESLCNWCAEYAKFHEVYNVVMRLCAHSNNSEKSPKLSNLS